MGIDIDTLVKFNLKKIKYLNKSDMQNIQEYDHYRRGVNLAIQYLSYKKRTERSYTVFRKNDIQSNAIQDVIDYCYKEKFIDHEDYRKFKTP